MRPYGRVKKVRFPSKRDCHPKKGYVNWWEYEYSNIRSRSTIKRIIKKEISNDNT